MTRKAGWLIVLVQVATLVTGLLASWGLLWVDSRLARLQQHLIFHLVVQALLYALLIWLWSVSITFMYLVPLRSDWMRVTRSVLSASAAAIWFPPALVVLYAFYPMVIAAAIVLIAGTTRLLISQRLLICIETGRPLLHSELPRGVFTRASAPGLAATFAIHASVLADLMRFPSLATVLLATGAAFLSSLSMLAGESETEKPASALRPILSFLLTLLLAPMVTGLPGLRAAATVRAEKKAPVEPAKPVDGSVKITDQSFPGVILWPKVEPVTKLIDPLVGAGTLGAGLARAVGIPFSGEYWMFKPPHLRPPRNSYFRRGTPLELSFLTTDGKPLEMEAHQKLDPAIDLACCSGIQVAIVNSDRYPGTVALELILIDSRVALSQSLGRSLAGLNPDPVSPLREVLDFAVPHQRVLRQFDEIKLIFHRDRMRVDHSAKIAIQRFVLVPRRI
jgi:hypothetical protein